MVQALHLAKARQFPHWLQGGPQRLDGEPRVYTSAATHFSVTRAAHVIGLGDAGLVRVAFASRGAMCPAALETALRQDRAAGRRPLAVVATVGSTGTGAIDPLSELADLCDEFGVWFHVDACYGGAAALLAGEQVLRAGLQRADSLCIDLHKWFFMPLTAGILLTRHADLVRQTFDVAASYIPVTDIAEAYCRGVPTSRRAAGLVAWFGLRTVGWNAMEEAIVRNIRLTRRLEQLLRQRGFRVMDDGALSIACARWEPVGWEAAALDALQSAISAEICRSGEAWFATTCHAGETWLRFNAVNLHTRDEHMDQLADIVTRVARRLAPPLEQSA
jgi:aromatic-L-amino-acid decarboxylase